MPTLEVTISLKRDGQTLPNFPLTRRIVLDETDIKLLQQASGGGFTALAGIPATVQAALIAPDQALSVRLNGQAAGEWTLNAGGLLLILDATINTAALIALSNASGSPANIQTVVGGT